MNDRPTAGELLDAVRLFLEGELAPGLTDPRQRFRTLVAANVLGIVGRELAGEESSLREEWQHLAGLLGDRRDADPTEPPAGLTDLRGEVRTQNERLCERIRAGAFDEPEAWRALAGELRTELVRKLEVNNPRRARGAKRPPI